VPGLAPGPAPQGDAIIGALIIGGLIVAALLILTVLAVDRRRRRRAEAIVLETGLLDRLMVEPRLAGTRLSVSVHAPWRRGLAPIVEMRGEVGSPELRALALRLAHQEALRFYPDARVEDRIFVAPPIIAGAV
jgi:hypothetical protein